MFVKQFRTGGDRNFGYLAADDAEGVAALIDPSFSPELLAEFAREKGYRIRYIFNTHRHPDHINGNAAAERMTGIVPVGFGDVEPSSRKVLGDGVILELGSLEIRILHTPGHTPDSICLYIGDSLFTGDTLFVGKVGGTDFGAAAEAEYHSLHRKLMTLPGETRIFPGHDYGTAPQSTISQEKRANPFLLRPDLESFIDLKVNWAEYKRAHGLD